jgi:hypothetical protein
MTFPPPVAVLAEVPSLSIAPVFPLWLMIPAFLAVAVLTAVLYFEQRRVASVWAVLPLILVRVGLLALLAILFLQPALKWTRTRTTAGTLWVVVDQSPSMQTPDPQALPAERLWWAAGMGFVPDRARPDRADALPARIHALAGEFAAIAPQTPAAAGGRPGDERAAVIAYAKRLSAWGDDLNGVFKAAGKAGTATTEGLDRARSTLFAGLPAVRGTDNGREAQAALDRYTILRALAAAERAAAADVRRADAAAAAGEAAAAASRVAGLSRQDLAQGLLAGPDAPAAKALAGLADKYHVRVAGFADKAQAAPPPAADPAGVAAALKAAAAPTGHATNLEAALQFVAEQVAADEAASVVVVSDGRNNVPGDPTAPARTLAARGVKVYGLLVGSHEVSPDAAVEQIDAPDWVYKGDAVKARALVRLDGLTGKSAVVEFRRGDTVLDRRTVKATADRQTEPVDFSDKPPESATAVEYQVRVAEMPGEVNTQNNVSTFRVAVKKDKLYALFVDSQPRWEFRYLAATLGRDPRMKIQTVLLAPAVINGVTPPAAVKASPDNPADEAQLLPTTADEWQRFDLIILGDVSPDTIGPQAQQSIAAAVRDKGATLILVAGRRAMPGAYANTPLADLLPVTLDGQWQADAIARHVRNGFRPDVAPAAGASVLAQFEVDSAANARLWSNVPAWYWHSPYTQAKPAASVLWTITDPAPAGNATALTSLAAANRQALLATMPIGAGRTLYLASDQTWRLRQVNGANMHERFWGQVLRWAVGSDLPAGGKFVRFGASQPTYTQDQPVTITARVLRDDLTPYTGLSFSAVARPVAAGGSATQPVGPAAQTAVEARFQPMEGGASPGFYTATLGGLPVGDVEIALRGPEVDRLLATDPSVTQKTLLIKIEPSMNAERRNMNTDPVLLDEVAKAGGGYSLDAQYADVLLSRLPAIEHTETLASQLGLFTDPAAPGTRAAHWSFLALFAALLTAEWLLRKRAGLV